MADEQDRRKEMRVALPVQCWFNIMGPGDVFVRSNPSLAASREAGELAASLEGRDEVERFLIKLDQKLDMVISLLVDRIGRKDYTDKAVVIDISESGLGLVTQESLPVGARLELGLILPSQPYTTMDVAAEVVWENLFEEAGSMGARSIGLRFTDILPQDQDEIVHWIFQKQREDIRRRKELD